MANYILIDEGEGPPDPITIGQVAKLLTPARGGERKCPSSLARKAIRKGLFKVWKRKIDGQLIASKAEVQPLVRFYRVYPTAR